MTTLVAFRVANWDTPVWANPNRRESRYARLGATVQYWSLHPLTCWAEHLRFHDIRDPVEADEQFLPGTRNLVLFGPRVRARYGIPPFDPSVDVPCDPIADVSRIVADLLPYVRWRGSPHAGYEAWLAGEPEPTPPAVPVLSTI